MTHQSEEEPGPYTLINVFYPVPGKLDEFIDLQIAETKALTPESSMVGWLGNEVYRAHDGSKAVIITRFSSEAAKQAWAASSAFVAHLERIRPLLDKINSTPVKLVARHAATGSTSA